MTICIAAIAKHNNEEVIVTATDQMITLTMNQTPIVQSFYEHTIEKYKIINKTTMALLAGNPLIFNDLIKLQATSTSFSQIRENIFNNFKNKRVDSIQKQLLNLYNTDWKFVIDALKTPNVSPPTLELLKIIANYKLGTEMGINVIVLSS